MGYSIGIDVGGTFTDTVVFNDRGEVGIYKIPTMTEDLASGFMRSLSEVASSYGLTLQELLKHVDKLAYGTTFATNMLIEGKVAKTGLITTKGFRDTLPIARISREYLDFDLQVERPPSLLPRSFIEEISERVDYAGHIVTGLDMDSLESVIQRLERKGVEAIAVCLLWSFKNSSHESKIKKFIEDTYPDMYISLSTEIAPIIGEYERTAVVVMNSMLGPPIKKWLLELSSRLKTSGLQIPLLIMQSSGGVTPTEDAYLKPVTLINSGPAGGTIASKYFSDLLSLPNLICIDMGGTSLDVSLITEGQYSTSLVSRVIGHNIFMPMVDVHSVGSGGGSIAWLDMGTRLKVGPQSAGAQPGPACYGRGGVEATVTDADVVLGRINADYFLGGEMPLNRDLAERAIYEKIAVPLGMSTMQAAAGICQIVDSNMTDAIRLVTVQKGYDPRDYALLAFGGAGPTHVSALARELGIKTVIIPFLATAQSAFGIVNSDIVHNFSISDLVELDDHQRINQHFESMERKGFDILKREQINEENMVMVRYADMRYKGQAHEVTMPVPVKLLNSDDLDQLADRFEEKYLQLYGSGTVFRTAGFEVVTLRMDAIGKILKPLLPQVKPERCDPSSAFKMQRSIFFEEEQTLVTTSVYDARKLKPGSVIEGPAIVEYHGTTAVIHPRQHARVDGYSNLIMEWEE